MAEAGDDPTRPSRGLQDRAQPLIEEAAERSRVSLGERIGRVRDAWRPIVQIAFAGTAAWLIATELVGHAAQSAFFAPVAAIITLSITQGQRGRRALELALGVTVGILVADLLAVVIGTGIWQLGLVLLLAMAAAVFVGTGQILSNQAAVSAALVVTLQTPEESFSFARSVDALIGCAVALVANAVILPADPVKLLRQAARPVLDELAGVLEDVAGALRGADHDAAEAALARARAIEPLESRFAEAVVTSRETLRMTATRRSARKRVLAYADAATQVDLAVRNVRVLARAAVRALELEEHIPPETAEAIEDLARAVGGLEARLDSPEAAADLRVPALRAAAGAALVLERTGNLSVSVIVGQVRSTAVDLLRAAGMPYEKAAEMVRQAAREAAASGRLEG